jgi:phytoene desaturase
LTSQNSKKIKVAILGSGIAGLAAAARLSQLGCEVTVFEQQPTYGGKMGEWSSRGYRFDTGPSLFTMPHYVDEIRNLGLKYEDDFEYERLNVVCNYFWKDGTELIAYSDLEKLIKEFEDKLGESPRNLKRYLNRSADRYAITNHVFLEKSLHKLSTYLHKSTLWSMLRLHKVGIFSSMHQENNKQFKNPKTIQFFDRYATYNGSNPYSAPATLNVIPHYEYGFGAYFPNNGIRSIATTVYNKAVALGATFLFNTPVKQVNRTKSGKFEVNNASVYDILVCNLDVSTAAKGPLRSLLKPQNAAYKPSSSALIFYWGIKKKFKELDVHNIFFSDNYKAEFKEIFSDQEIGQDPTIYIHISSKANPQDAPEYGENWFVMVNAPYVAEQDWKKQIARTRERILARLSHQLGEEIESLIEVEEMLTPQLIYEKTGSYKGALYGSSSNNPLSAFLRQPNFSKKHKGLYFCGGSVHPGGGIPLALLSAKITSNIIKQDYELG